MKISIIIKILRLQKYKNYKKSELLFTFGYLPVGKGVAPSVGDQENDADNLFPQDDPCLLKLIYALGCQLSSISGE